MRDASSRCSRRLVLLGIALASILAGAACGGSSGGDPQAFDVMVDPYSMSPLTAVVNVRGLQASDVDSFDVVVKGQDGAPDLARSYRPGAPGYDQRWGTPELAFPASGLHLPVVGLFPDRVNEVNVAVHANSGRTFATTLSMETNLTDPADPLGAWIPEIQVSAADPSRMEPGWTVVELDLGDVGRLWARPIAFDERGTIRWALRLDFLGDYALPLYRSSISGNFITGRFGQLVEVTELGRIVRRWSLPGYLAHHEVQEIQDGPRRGHLLVSVDKSPAATVEDRVVEVDRDSGSIVQVWDLTQVLDPSRTAFPIWPTDWFHNNGIAYSASDDTLVLSGRHQGVVKIDRSNQLVWILAPHRGWNSPQAERLLSAVSGAGIPYLDEIQDGGTFAGPGEFDWPWGQHAPSLLPNGDLLVFDNGWIRRFDMTAPPYSRAVIYRVDEAAMTVRQVREWGADRGTAHYSMIVSDALLLPVTGNLLVAPGVTEIGTPNSSTYVTEVTPGDQVVFDVRVRFANALAAGGVRGAMDFSYRAHRYEF